MKKPILIAAALLLLSGLWGETFANALRITNLSRDSTNQTVSFDLEWDNSWRVDSSGSPYNWDAAWVFVKFRPCGSASTTPWTHGKLDPTSGMNGFGTLEPHAVGSGNGFYADSNGVMLRRNANGIFPNSGTSSITLRVDNIASVGQFDVKVFGIEMVYVPEESFALGMSSPNYYTFNDGAGNPVTISSENAISPLYAANSNSSNFQTYSTNVPAAYPKGFQAFYTMKYEISAGQYAAFLNTITSPAQLNRYPGNYNLYRNRLNNNGTPPDIYIAEREDRAQNYLSWFDIGTYFDWACLRFMTELEYEKICRGPAPTVLNEYAWGTNIVFQAQTISTAPEDGTETIFNPTNANATHSNYNFNGGDGGRGPVRVGIFAKPTSNSRLTTGATYYGVMEMSGNVTEACVEVRHTAYDGQWGDGNITSAGMFDVANWNQVNPQYYIWRGGSFYWGVQNLRVSDRQYFQRTDYANRYQYNGGRGLR